MSETVFSIRLNNSLFRAAAQLASRKGKSVEDWLAAIALDHISEQVRLERIAYPAPRTSDGPKLMKLLSKSPNRPPGPGDEFEL